MMSIFIFFKQKTAYEMRIIYWSSDVGSSDLRQRPRNPDALALATRQSIGHPARDVARQIDQIEQFADARVIPSFSVETKADRDILGHGHMREKPDILEDVTDPPPQPVRLDRDHGRPVYQHRSDERRVGKEGGGKER